MGKQRIVLCMKWGALYPAEYVNVLYRAVCKNLEKPFRFVCLTDDASGLIDGIEHFRLPDEELKDWHWEVSGIWPKLILFRKDLYGLSGRCLFIDLDMVISNSLEPFFEYNAPMVTTDMGPNWKPGFGDLPKEAGTCIFAFDIGEQSQIYEGFINNDREVTAKYPLEQDWVHAAATSMDYWPDGWVVSFKRFLRRPVGLDLFMEPKDPGDVVKVLAFHGEPRPIDLLNPKWGKFPHSGRRPVSWMVKYWVENGGKIPD